MNVFISHKREDELTARTIAVRCGAQGVAFYLDVFDPSASSRGNELGEHLRRIMGVCTHLLAVVSESTKESWWVPWEIGIATEKDFPISTYADGQCELPTYLKKWPYLTQLQQVDLWIAASREAENQAQRMKNFGESNSEIRSRSTREFYTRVRRALGQ